MRKLFFILISFFSCSKIDENGFKDYIIKKGNHRSVCKYKTTYNENFKLEVIFDESAQYQSVDPINQYDVNKLWGVSDCGQGHMKSSIRFGWRWLNDTLEILWFKHQFGEFDFETIATVEINQVNNLELNISDTEYTLSVNGVSKTTPRSCSGVYKKYILYPYFGGDEVAPHNIKIKLKGV
tara:strand:+ start:2952 stop:3494 length:543 start_codon:yes stop_codon:yes gene_type:complete